MSFKCVPIYGLMFRILTRYHALYFGASCIHRNSIVWRRLNLARFPYWPEKRKRRISRYSYLMKTLISSEYGLTISGHVTVLGQWLSEKNTDYKLKSSMDLNVSSSVLEALRGIWRKPSWTGSMFSSVSANDPYDWPSFTVSSLYKVQLSAAWLWPRAKRCAFTIVT